MEDPTTVGSAAALAERAAAGLRAEPDPLSDRAWEKVALRLVPNGPDRVSLGYDREPDRRLVTVWVDGDRACVDVRAGRVESYPGDCR